MVEYEQQILIRLSKEKKAQAIHDAHKRDMTLSKYIRMLIDLGHQLQAYQNNK